MIWNKGIVLEQGDGFGTGGRFFRSTFPTKEMFYVIYGFLRITVHTEAYNLIVML